MAIDRGTQNLRSRCDRHGWKRLRTGVPCARRMIPLESRVREIRTPGSDRYVEFNITIRTTPSAPPPVRSGFPSRNQTWKGRPIESRSAVWCRPSLASTCSPEEWHRFRKADHHPAHHSLPRKCPSYDPRPSQWQGHNRDPWRELPLEERSSDLSLRVPDQRESQRVSWNTHAGAHSGGTGRVDSGPARTVGGSATSTRIKRGDSGRDRLATVTFVPSGYSMNR